jgi:hypothetical protein
MRGLLRTLFLSVASSVVGWLVATLFRRRALISIGRARGRDAPIVLDTERVGGRGSPSRSS